MEDLIDVSHVKVRLFWVCVARIMTRTIRIAPEVFTMPFNVILLAGTVSFAGIRDRRFRAFANGV